jgi:hypothetical protein
MVTLQKNILREIPSPRFKTRDSTVSRNSTSFLQATLPRSSKRQEDFTAALAR